LALNEDSWNKYQKLVLTKLEDHDHVLKDITSQLTDIRVDLGQLKVKSGIWGLLGGAIPAISAILFILLK